MRSDACIVCEGQPSLSPNANDRGVKRIKSSRFKPSKRTLLCSLKRSMYFRKAGRSFQFQIECLIRHLRDNNKYFAHHNTRFNHIFDPKLIIAQYRLLPIVNQAIVPILNNIKLAKSYARCLLCKFANYLPHCSFNMCSKESSDSLLDTGHLRKKRALTPRRSCQLVRPI